MNGETLADPLFETAILLASDYDETQFHTFDPAPEGIGVNEAYELAIAQVLGPYALDEYRRQGGHNNRTPSEIVESLLGRSNGHLLEKIVDLSRDGASGEDLYEFVANQPEPDMVQGWIWAPEEQLRIISGVVVEFKLKPLTRQIGQRIDENSFWPRPTKGFIDFAKAIEDARKGGQIINTATISAGHAKFILRTYELYDIPEPDILVTDETIQANNVHISAERRAKPAPYPMALAKREWLRMHRQSAIKLRDPTTSADINARIVYTGDDQTKDGGLATASRVDFVLHDKNKSQESWQEVGRRIRLGNMAVQGAEG